MFAPCADVPLPAGRLVPSGSTEISHALMSASDSGLPRFGDGTPAFCATATPVPNASAAARAKTGLRVEMFDLPFAFDAPTGDAVVVVVREPQTAHERVLRLAPRRH